MRDQLAAADHHCTSSMIPKLAFFITFLTVTLLVIIFPPFEFANNPRKIFESATSFGYFYSTNSSSGGTDQEEGEEMAAGSAENCDLFTGDWIPYLDGPYYTNETCLIMQDYKNCMKLGRKPDSEYLKWRWKPDGCELPKFDPEKFLELVRGKSMAFVGDSLARNQFESLGCLLSWVAVPDEDVSSPEYPKTHDWVYKNYSFNMSTYRSNHLVHTEISGNGPVNLYLDELHEHWTSQIGKHDYIIISAGPWFEHGNKYYENRRLIGCNACNDEGVPDIGFYSAYQKALRTVLRAITELARPETLVFVRSVSPLHFEGGMWHEGGYCNRTKPFGRRETGLDPYSAIMHGIQLEELKVAREERRKKGLRPVGMLDVTRSMRLRPDGHPGKYEENRYDCLHWCLPGPIDVWNEFLLQLILRDQGHDTSENTI